MSTSTLDRTDAAHQHSTSTATMVRVFAAQQRSTTTDFPDTTVKPTRAEVINAIMAATGLKWHPACKVVCFAENRINDARQNEDGTVTLDHPKWHEDSYHNLCKIWPPSRLPGMSYATPAGQQLIAYLRRPGEETFWHCHKFGLLTVGCTIGITRSTADSAA